MISVGIKTKQEIKGELGEKLVKKILESQGFIIYSPETKGAHAFDIMAIKEKKDMIIADVKTKPKRHKYCDTGINEKHYQTYKYFSEKHNAEFWLIFVDEEENMIYGNILSELDKPKRMQGTQYPLIETSRYGVDIRYWPRSAMLDICNIDDDISLKLKGLRESRYMMQLLREDNNG